jgi:ribosome production factor 2
MFASFGKEKNSCGCFLGSKPKTHRAKRALLARAPQMVEDEKQMMFLKGAKCPQTVTTLMRELASMRKPLAQVFTKKNELRPFEDVTPLENFARQHHMPVFGFGNSQKKRPNNLVLGECWMRVVLF